MLLQGLGKFIRKHFNFVKFIQFMQENASESQDGCLSHALQVFCTGPMLHLSFLFQQNIGSAGTRRVQAGVGLIVISEYFSVHLNQCSIVPSCWSEMKTIQRKEPLWNVVKEKSVTPGKITGSQNGKVPHWDCLFRASLPCSWQLLGLFINMVSPCNLTHL